MSNDEQDPTNPPPGGEPPFEVNDPNAGYYPPQPEPPEEEDELSLERNRPSVATGSGKLVVFAFFFLSVMIYIIYSIFSGDSGKKEVSGIQAERPAQGEIAVAPQPSAPITPPPGQVAVNNTPPTLPPASPPPPPPPPPSVNLPPPPTLPPPPAPPPPPSSNAARNATDNLSVVPPVRQLGRIGGGDAAQEKRLRSNIMVINGDKSVAARASALTSSTRATDTLASQDPNLAFSNEVGKLGASDKSTATRVENLDRTIIQGKIVDAVLETAINTDLPGTLRAVISRDVYAEAGRNIMIPKGSRLLGRYNTGILRGQKRVFIVWTRVVRPDGVDIAIGSNATDPMGRAGVAGLVDNKYLETFSAALLTSVVSLGLAVVTDKVIDNPNTTTTTGIGSVTTGSAGADAARQGVENFGNIGRSVIDGVLDARPTITVDQGTRINVFVNKDLTFPADTTGADALFVQ